MLLGPLVGGRHQRLRRSASIRPAQLEFWVGDGTATDAVTAEVKLIARVWYFVAASYDPASGARHALPGAGDQPLQQPALEGRSVRVPFACARDAARAPGAARPNGLRDRRCDRAQPGARDLLQPVLQWQDRPLRRAGRGARPRGARRDPRRRPAGRGGVLGVLGYDAPAIPSTGSATRWSTPARTSCTREGYNRPVRGQTGWNWTGRNDCFRLAPQEFGGIEFHADALIDCHWEPTLSLTIPTDSRSGVYAVKLTAGDGTGLPRNTRRSSSAPSDAESADLPADPDGELSRLCQYPDRIRWRAAAVDHRLDADLPGDRCRGLQERRRVRALHLRHAQ